MDKPLYDLGILDAVLSCLEGEGIFVCSVCKLWRASWQGKGGGGGGEKKKRRLLRSRLSSNSTSYAAAFASAARFSLALEWGMSLNGRSQDEVEHCAGRYADIATLEEAHRLGMRWTDSVLVGAAESNDVSKLIWLRDAQEVVFPKLSIELAVAAGSIDALRWLKQQEAFRDEPLPQYDSSWLQARPQLTWRRSPLTTFSLGDKMSYTAASKAGNLPMLRYLHEEGCPWHHDTCGVAAASGDLEQLKWLHANGAELNEGTADIAVTGGAIPVFEWLQQQGVEFNELTMLAAAAEGRTELCAWLRQNGCPWHAYACYAAAERSHFETLRWLHEHGCDWDVQRAGAAAVTCGRSAMLGFLQELGLLCSADLLTHLLCVAGTNNNLAAAKWLRQRGAEWPEQLKAPDSDLSWTSELVRWARAEGCTVVL
jgi:hypothetical protein